MKKCSSGWKKSAAISASKSPQKRSIRRYVNKEDLVNSILASRSGGVYKTPREGRK